MDMLPHAKIRLEIKAVWLDGVGFKILFRKQPTNTFWVVVT